MWSGVVDAMGGAAFAPPEKQAEAMEKMINTLDRCLTLASQHKTTNNWKYIAGDKLTPADFALSTFYFNLAKNEQSPFKDAIAPVYAKHTALQNVWDELASSMAEYFEKRDKA